MFMKKKTGEGTPGNETTPQAQNRNQQKESKKQNKKESQQQKQKEDQTKIAQQKDKVK